jgi:hypothetical protein
MWNDLSIVYFKEEVTITLGNGCVVRDGMYLILPESSCSLISEKGVYYSQK